MKFCLEVLGRWGNIAREILEALLLLTLKIQETIQSIGLCYQAVKETYCNERVCSFVSVCLSASSSPKLHVRSLSILCACYYGSGSVLLMFQKANDALFRTILSNRSHVLYTYLSERPEIAYSLRTRIHNKIIITKTSDLGDRRFIIRSLYKNLY